VTTLQLALATRGVMPGSVRRARLLWAVWALALLGVLAALAWSFDPWRRAQRAHELAAAVPQSLDPGAKDSRAQPQQEDALLSRLQISDPKASALQTLQLALQGASGVQLVSAEFSARPAASPDQLDRLDASIQLRGPYGAVKQVIAQWSQRFESSSVIALRVQRTANAPGVVDATVSAALWSRPSGVASGSPAAAASAGR
jgi:hypothetical protein